MVISGTFFSTTFTLGLKGSEINPPLESQACFGMFSNERAKTASCSCMESNCFNLAASAKEDWNSSVASAPKSATQHLDHPLKSLKHGHLEKLGLLYYTRCALHKIDGLDKLTPIDICFQENNDFPRIKKKHILNQEVFFALNNAAVKQGMSPEIARLDAHGTKPRCTRQLTNTTTISNPHSQAPGTSISTIL